MTFPPDLKKNLSADNLGGFMNHLLNVICLRECQVFITLEGAVRQIALTRAKLTLFLALPRKSVSGGFPSIEESFVRIVLLSLLSGYI